MAISKKYHLSTVFWTCFPADGNHQEITIREKLATALSYVFSVDMPDQNSDGDYRFPSDSVETIEEQLDGISVSSLSRGKIDIDVLLLMCNSPRFPYTVHTNSMFAEGKHWVYYRFILDRNIILDRDSPKTKET